MNWYEKLAQQTWSVLCPRCLEEWRISQGTPGWIAARQSQLQGRQAKVTCDKCLRERRQKPEPK